MNGFAAAHRPLDRTASGPTFGVLVPHFGKHATIDRILEGSVRAEDAGFDAVWVRDHLLWQPHAMEGTSQVFVEPLAVLAAIAARTRRIQLGTAVLVPLRWPLKLAQDLASLAYLANGRIVAGLGLGSGAELPAVGFAKRDRKRIFVETTQIVREVWSRDRASYEGELFRFSDVTLQPKPPCPIPIWYGGTSRVSVENAIRYCDGWIPGRIPLATLDDRLGYLAELSAAASRPKVSTAVIPLVKVDRDRRRARSGIDVEALGGSSEASKNWIVPDGGFREIDDLRGIICVGEPAEVAEQVMEICDRGVDHFVFDLRLQFDRYEAALDLIAEEVLPQLRHSVPTSIPHTAGPSGG